MRNPYFVLGIQPSAEKDEIKKAYRRLAMVFHPDRNGDDFGAQERFAEINAAYHLLCDDELRRLFDAGLIDGAGRKRPGPASARRADPFAGVDINRRRPEPDTKSSREDFGSRIFGEAFRKSSPDDPGGEKPNGKEAHAASAGASAFARSTVNDPPGIDDVPTSQSRETNRKRDDIEPKRHWGLVDLALKPLRDFLTSRGGQDPNEPADTEIELIVSLRDIIKGERQTLTLPDGGVVDIDIAQGQPDGSHIRLVGRGRRAAGGLAGDAVIQVRHERRRDLRSEGLDIHQEVAISLDEAVLGTAKTIETPAGKMTIDVPEWSGSDRHIELPHCGLPGSDGTRGKLVAELRLLLPEERDEKIVDLVRLRRGEWYV